MFKIWRSPSISGAYALRRGRSAASTAVEVVVEKPIVYKGRGKYVYFVRPNGLQTPLGESVRIEAPNIKVAHKMATAMALESKPQPH